MIFPIKIRKRKVFIRYRGHWINVNHETIARGGGIRGSVRFVMSWARCAVGAHTIGHFAGLSTEDGRLVFKSYTACMICHGHKVDSDRE